MMQVLAEKQIIYYPLLQVVPLAVAVVVVAALSASELELVATLAASYTLVLAFVLEQMTQIVAVVSVALQQWDLMQYTWGLMQYTLG
jgi:hypothetical protein